MTEREKFMTCFVLPGLSVYSSWFAVSEVENLLDSLCTMFQVAINGTVLGQGVGSTWEEARIHVNQLNPYLCSDPIVFFCLMFFYL